MSYSSRQPVTTPVIVNLPENGLRLRFNGPDQRLRLIEILSFDQSKFAFKGKDLAVQHDAASARLRTPQPSLTYRRIYDLFGPSYPGEYQCPASSTETGVYVLSFSGIAFSFPLATSAYTPHGDHADMLSSAGSSVQSVAVFDGRSWPEARKQLFDGQALLSESVSPVARAKDGLPNMVEGLRLHGSGKIEVLHRTSPPTWMVTGQTTAQDLLNDLGPPDAIYKPPTQADETPAKMVRPARRRSSGAIRNSYGSTPSSYSSTNTDTYDADFEEDDGIDGPDIVRERDQYFCYFEHGLDVLLGHAATISPLPVWLRGDDNTSDAAQHSADGATPTVARVIIHGNVPGSYSFNRHRRCRWVLDHINSPANKEQASLTSESKFTEIQPHLLKVFQDVWPAKDMTEGMVIVRDWNDGSPSGSAILIGDDLEDDEEEPHDARTGEQWLKNTQLYKFPGLSFEVMHNGDVSALTVY